MLIGLRIGARIGPNPRDRRLDVLPCGLAARELLPQVRHEFGDGCKKVLENAAGDFIYIKPGVPHEVFNMSDTEPVVAFVARSSASEWDDIVPYDRDSKT